MNKCKVENCDNEAISNELCNKHLNDYYNAGYDKGVYKLVFKDSNKVYIGSTVEQGFNVRKSKHKHELTKGLMKTGSSKKLLEYFNELCDKNKELSRVEVFEQYVELVPIKEGSIFIPVQSDDKKFRIINDKKAKRESYSLMLSGNIDVQNAIKEVDTFFRNIEKRLIREYKEADIKNGTDYCLNEVS